MEHPTAQLGGGGELTHGSYRVEVEDIYAIADAAGQAVRVVPLDQAAFDAFWS